MDTTYTYTYTTTSTNIDPAMMPFFWTVWIIGMALGILGLVSAWKLYAKAGKPGWAVIVPVYNAIVMLEIVGRPLWWILLLFIPLVNIVVGIIVVLDFAKAYGKGTGYGVLMLFFPYIMYPVLAFSKSTRYVGPVAAKDVPVEPTQTQE